MENIIKVFKNKSGDRYVKVPIKFKLKIFLDENVDISRISLKTIEASLNEMERIDLGEEILNKIKLEDVIREENNEDSKENSVL